LVALVDVSDDRLTSFIDVDVLGVWVASNGRLEELGWDTAPSGSLGE
jgi:hypothetical protein